MIDPKCCRILFYFSIGALKIIHFSLVALNQSKINKDGLKKISVRKKIFQIKKMRGRITQV